MVTVHILTMIFTGPEQPAILVLEPDEQSPLEGKQRILPVWIGAQEAMQIGVQLEQIKPPRPLTHDLFLDALTNLDARIDHAIINEVAGQTFFAKLYLRQAGRLIELDARPTDAIALALREGAPVYVDEHVMNKASFPFILKKGANKEKEIKEWHSFVEDLRPEDLL